MFWKIKADVELSLYSNLDLYRPQYVCSASNMPEGLTFNFRLKFSPKKGVPAVG